MKEGLLLNRIALHSAGISPRNQQYSATIKTNLANSWLSIGNGAAMTAGETPDTIAIKLLVEIAFADILVNDFAKGRHDASDC
jgi:hypothetical protein